MAIDNELFETNEPTETVTATSVAEHVAHESYDEKDHGFKVSLKADTLGYIGNFPITNTMVTSLVGSVVLIVLVLVLAFRLKKVPGKMQSLFELMIEKGYEYTLSVLENETVARKTFPLIASLFVFILFFNLVKFLPGIESITYNDKILFKPLHKDFNMTFALGMTAFIFIQAMGIFVLGAFKYSSKFINIKKPLLIPLGIIELISEVAKVISLSFRLFGSMLVGGILLLLVSHTVHILLPVPVILFEIFVAFLQASIFALLTLIYIKLAIDEPH